MLWIDQLEIKFVEETKIPTKIKERFPIIWPGTQGYVQCPEWTWLQRKPLQWESCWAPSGPHWCPELWEEKWGFLILIQWLEAGLWSPVCSLFSPSLWTPPMPPVTNTGMPARWAAIIVADTVVPPERHCRVTQESVWALARLVDMTHFWISVAYESASHFAEHVGQITTGHLHGALALSEVVQLLRCQAYAELALDHPHCGWGGSFFPHDGFHLFCSAGRKTPKTQHQELILSGAHTYTPHGPGIELTTFTGLHLSPIWQ